MNPAAGRVLDRFRLDGKVVLVTGASSGLGAGFARATAAVGATLVLVARRAERLQALADELADAGTDVVVAPADVSQRADCRAVADLAVERFGRIDVLVNNAGLGGAVTAFKESEEHFRSVVDLNLHGCYWMAQACAPHMPEGSAIVNVSSVHGLVASPFPQAAYTASKSGLLGLTRDLAAQWSGRHGIRVNALCPGYFASEMTQAPALQEMVAERSILGRFGEQEELDSALLFLASPASSYMTGAALTIDGGMSAW